MLFPIASKKKDHNYHFCNTWQNLKGKHNKADVIEHVFENGTRRNEKTSEGRKHCALAEPKIFTLPQTPFAGACASQNLMSWRWSLPLPTNRVW